ncbi:TM2 domain-containing protein [Mucilaginibacter oryzae]|uniref:TM2 domain-containing protein n=1 Tax=Mucilaginibacter oryzae TaxID=468058 RepID=A0A316H254_9SPHI|nr:TM2 domain-containing protein [Mucilaginibacter oryzae]PWK72966.1 TM2 domain-containing protein [Mucilaginibacter oryzae]
MNMYQDQYNAFAGFSPEELGFLQYATPDLTESQKKYFYMVYANKRKNSQDILLFTLLGFVLVAGVQRFVLGQTGMGILYLLTGGFCGIGTIVDLINNKSLTLEYNKNMAYESYQMAKMSS